MHQSKNKIQSNINKVKKEIDNHAETLISSINKIAKRLHNELDNYRDELFE
jgi:hypothetical protein